mmetsp:Transcript_53073/g.168432  ORF Transcript_53073/g.168432 Transcript_53073/m.168432 type:complete len:211 (+) Transcript_53073:246-878(+)
MQTEVHTHPSRSPRPPPHPPVLLRTLRPPPHEKAAPRLRSPTRLPLLGLVAVAGQQHRGPDAGPQDARHDEQRDAGRAVDPSKVRDHLRPDEAEDDRHGGLQVLELRHGVRHEAEEGPQGQDGEDVGAVDDEGVPGHPEHRGDGVHGEHHVRELDDREHQQQRGGHLDAVLHGPEVVAVVIVAHRHKLAAELHDGVVLEVLLLILVLAGE